LTINNKSGNDRKEMEFYNEIEDIVGDNPAVSPKVIISSTDGLTHREKQGTVKKNLKRKMTAVSDASKSSSPNPAVSASDDEEQEQDINSDLASSNPNHAQVNQGKKEKPKKRAAKKTELLARLGNYQEQAKAAEEARLQLAQKIYSDNMAIMTGLLDVLKQAVSKK